MTEAGAEFNHNMEIVQAEEMFDALLIEGLDGHEALCMVSEAMPDWPFLALGWELIGIGREYRHTEGGGTDGWGGAGDVVLRGGHIRGDGDRLHGEEDAKS